MGKQLAARGTGGLSDISERIAQQGGSLWLEYGQAGAKLEEQQLDGEQVKRFRSLIFE